VFAPKNLPVVCAVLGTLIAIVPAGDSPRSEDAAQSCAEILQGPSSESQISAAPEITLRRQQADGDVEQHAMVCHRDLTASAMAKAKGGKASVDVTVSAGGGSGGASASSRATSHATSR